MEAGYNIALQEFWPYFLVAARVAGLITSAPGFSESFVSSRVRIFLVLGLTLAITPLLSESLIQATVGSTHALLLLIGEFVVGIFMGLMGKVVMSALDVAGSVIGFQISLSNAFVFNPSQGQQTNVMGTFLAMTVLVLIFVQDLHYLMIRGLLDSYTFMMPGKMLPFENMSQIMVEVVSKSFLMGAKIAAPFIILGTTIFVALGMLNRLMPQVQVYFISQPFVIGVGLMVLAVTLGALMNMTMEFVQSYFGYFVAKG